jgi:integrase
MPEAKFVLKEPNCNEPTLVYLFLRFNGQKLKYSTGQKIHPKFWNDEKQLAKETRLFVGYESFNALIKKMGSESEEYHRTLLSNGIKPTPEIIRDYLNEKFHKTVTEPKPELTLLDFIDEFIKTSNKKIGTIKQYKLAYNNLKEYQEVSNKVVDFDTIDVAFYDDYMRFLLNKNFGKDDEVKKYGTNTIGARIKNLKVFLNEAVERGLTSNLQFRSKRFKKPNEKSESIYLSIKEIDNIYKLDLSENPRLDKVRDLFIIGCYTGLRFSDLIQIKNENLIDKNTKLKIKTEKTGELVIIPLHNYIREIIKKYDGNPPPLISNNKMNEYLKEIGQLAKINEDVVISSTKGGETQSESFKKHELITVHTSRRSFATNAYLNDIPSISIMKITGHHTEKAFLTYIKISQEENANKLLNHPFFN